MVTRILTPTADMAAFRLELLQLCDKHVGKLPCVHMLVIAAQAVGLIMAFQDQRNMTADEAIQIVQANMEIGNISAIADVTNVTGTVQ